MDDVDLLPSDSNKKKDIPILTEEQQSLIVKMWNEGKDGLKELVAAVFGPQFDGRSKEAFAVKKFLAERKLKARPAHEYASKSYDLTDEQKGFIRTNAETMKPMEILKAMFPNIENISIASKEGRAVLEFYRSLDIHYKVTGLDNEAVSQWYPPRQYSQAIARINNYCSLNKPLDLNKLTNKEKARLDALMRYLNVFRFNFIMNEYRDKRDRELMESSFIRFVNDKTDLTEEEVDLYMNWCVDIVHYTRLQRELESLIQARDRFLQENDGKLPQALVEQINSIYSALDSNQKRQKIAQNDLSGKRKDRVESLGNQNINLLTIVDNYKEFQQRKLMLDLAEARKAEISTEFDRLESMEDLKFRMFGISKNEILNGI